MPKNTDSKTTDKPAPYIVRLFGAAQQKEHEAFLCEHVAQGYRLRAVQAIMANGSTHGLVVTLEHASVISAVPREGVLQ